MNSEQEQRIEKFNDASDVVKLLYSDPSSGEFLWNLYASIVGEQFNYSQYTQFAIAVGDVILGIHKRETLHQQLQIKMKDTPESQIIALVEGLTSLLDKIPEQLLASEGPTVFTTSTPPSITQNTQPTPSTEQQTEQGNIANLKPLRTFGEDVAISRAHSYGAFQNGGAHDDPDITPVHRSSQDDVLGGRK